MIMWDYRDQLKEVTLDTNCNKTITQIDNDGHTKTTRYQYDNHLGSASLELDNKGGFISYEEYHPFGTTSYRSGKNKAEVSLKRYKYVGKERDNETGFYYYGARYYSSWLGRFLSVDPLAGKYLNLNPYCYVGNMPLIAYDPDGKVIKIVGTRKINSKAFIQVAATFKGGEKIKALINEKSIFPYKINFNSKSNYDEKKKQINYNDRYFPIVQSFDISSISPMISLGHEISHAVDHHNKHLFSMDNNGHRILNRAYTERNAGNFGNYLRSVYDKEFYRDKYMYKGKLLVHYNTDETYVNPINEKITDIELIGDTKISKGDYFGGIMVTKPSFSLEAGQMSAASYTHTYDTEDNKTVTEKMYILTWMNKDSEINFFKTSNKQLFDNTVDKMKKNYSFSSETTYISGMK